MGVLCLENVESFQFLYKSSFSYIEFAGGKGLFPVSIKGRGGGGGGGGGFSDVIYNFLFLSNTREGSGLSLDCK